MIKETEKEMLIRQKNAIQEERPILPSRMELLECVLLGGIFILAVLNQS